jgi:hypothetical protein
MPYNFQLGRAVFSLNLNLSLAVPSRPARLLLCEVIYCHNVFRHCPLLLTFFPIASAIDVIPEHTVFQLQVDCSVSLSSPESSPALP